MRSETTIAMTDSIALNLLILVLAIPLTVMLFLKLPRRLRLVCSIISIIGTFIGAVLLVHTQFIVAGAATGALLSILAFTYFRHSVLKDLKEQLPMVCQVKVFGMNKFAERNLPLSQEITLEELYLEADRDNISDSEEKVVRHMIKHIGTIGHETSRSPEVGLYPCVYPIVTFSISLNDLSTYKQRLNDKLAYWSNHHD